MNASLLNLVVDKSKPIQLWEDQVLLLEYESRNIPVIELFRETRFCSNSSDLIWAQHHGYNLLAEFELITLAFNLVDQILFLLIVLLVQVFDFAIMVLILFPKRINDVALSFDLSLKVLVGFLDHQNLLFFLLLFFEKLFFTLLLSLQLFLEFPELAGLFFFFLSESVTTSDEFLLELFHHVFKLVLLVLGVVEFLLFSFDHRLDLILLFFLLFKLIEQLRILLNHDLRLRCRSLRWRLHHWDI